MRGWVVAWSSVLAAALAVSVVTARPAAACSLFENLPFVTDPGQAGDTTPPGPVVASATFEAFAAHERANCGPDGAVNVDASATDDATPAGSLGYQVRVIQGDFFGAFPTEPITHGVVPQLVFYTSRLDVDVVLELRAVDLAGNLGPPTRITVPHPIVDDGGCATGGRGSLAVGLALLGLGRRRRRPAP